MFTFIFWGESMQAIVGSASHHSARSHGGSAPHTRISGEQAPIAVLCALCLTAVEAEAWWRIIARAKCFKSPHAIVRLAVDGDLHDQLPSDWGGADVRVDGCAFADALSRFLNPHAGILRCVGRGARGMVYEFVGHPLSYSVIICSEERLPDTNGLPTVPGFGPERFATAQV